MSYTTVMQSTFEAEKNKKAFLYTLIICSVLLLLSFMIRWNLNTPFKPLAEDLIEVNLGNDMEGYGEEQPLVKGEMGNVKQEEIPQSTAATTDENVVEPEDDREDAAPVSNIKKNVKPQPTNNTPAVKSTKSTTKNAVNNPAPKPKQPSAIYSGPGKGGGNNANVDNGYRYQGNNPNGKGDKGSPNGNPDSYGNTPGGKTGVSVTRGVRPLNLGVLKFEDNFNENAKVYLDVRYNSAGIVTSSAPSKGTTTSNSTILSIARRKAAELKFPPSDDGGVSTILFNFRIQN